LKIPAPGAEYSLTENAGSPFQAEPTQIQAIRTLVLLSLFLPVPLIASGQNTRARVKAYPLSTWSNITCRSKGRFQDRDYCASAVIDQIVEDGTSAIPILVSQITDPRWINEPVYDYWPRIRAGELAYFILGDLFLDDTWQKSTMPALFPAQNCNEAASACWERFRKTHSLKELRDRWTEFWKANQSRIYWDRTARRAASDSRLPPVAISGRDRFESLRINTRRP
jgi:hypothetical protein